MIVLLHVKSINLQTTKLNYGLLRMYSEVVVVNYQEAVKIMAAVVVVVVINYQYSIGCLTYKNLPMKITLMVLKFALKGVVKSFIITQKKFLCKLVM